MKAEERPPRQTELSTNSSARSTAISRPKSGRSEEAETADAIRLKSVKRRFIGIDFHRRLPLSGRFSFKLAISADDRMSFAALFSCLNVECVATRAHIFLAQLRCSVSARIHLSAERSAERCRKRIGYATRHCRTETMRRPPSSPLKTSSSRNEETQLGYLFIVRYCGSRALGRRNY